MNANELPISEPLRSPRIPIAQLSPEVDRLPENSIHATVTLLWPYSSSTKSLSLLLAEPDVRLRRSNGQVKVIFHGHIAEDVAKTKIGIGDNVNLGLAGSRFVGNEAAIQIPGKCVAWDVHYDDRVFLEISRSSEHLSTVKIDPPSSPLQNAEPTTTTPSTPIANGHRHAGGFEYGTTMGSWQSPAFTGRSRTSFGGFVDSAFDPFTEEDGHVPGKGRKRPRFSMRNSDWRVIDEPESPGDNDIPLDWTHIFDEEVEAELEKESDIDKEDIVEKPSEASETAGTNANEQKNADAVEDAEADVTMTPASPEITVTSPGRIEAGGQFLHPRFAQKAQFPRMSDRPSIFDHAAHLPTDTPRLHPIPSPGLPIPSPLVTTPNGQTSYFTPVATTAESEDNSTTSILPHATTSSEHETSAVQLDTSRSQVGEHAELNLKLPNQTVTSAESTIEIHANSTEPQVIDSSTIATAVASDHQINEGPRVAVDHAQDQLVSAPNKVTTQKEHLLEDGEELEEDAIEVGGQEIEEDHGETLPQETEDIEEDELEDGSEEEEQEYDEHQQAESCVIAEDLHPERIPDAVEYDSEGSEENSPLKNQEALEPGSGYDARDEEDDDEEDDEEDEDDEDVDMDEERYEGKDEEDEDMESIYDEEDELDESEMDSDSRSVESSAQYRPAPKNIQPEIIVLDSDSEDEAPVASHTRVEQQPARQTASGEESASPGHSEDEDSASDDSSIDSEGGEWPEAEDGPEDGKLEGELEKADYVEDEESEDEEIGDVEGEDEEDEEEEEDENEDEDEDEEMENEMEEDEREEEDEVVLLEYSRVERNKERPSQASEQESEQEENEQIKVEEQAESTMETKTGMSPIASARDSNVEEQLVSRPNSEEVYTTPQPAQAHEQETFARVSENAHSFGDYHSNSADMAIDPQLYNTVTGQAEAIGEPSQRHPQEDDLVADREEAGASRTMYTGLMLDGAASPPYASTTAAPERDSQVGQLLTPGSSQLTGVGEPRPVTSSVDDMLPTPQPTQDSPSPNLQNQGEIPPQAQTVHDASPILKKEASPVVDNTNGLDSIVESQERHNEPEEPLVYESTEASGDSHLSAVDRRYPGLRSKLSYFAPLATLIDHYNALVDTISIASEVRPVFRAVTGKKDYISTFQVTDPSMAGTVIQVQIFRPFKTALPSLEEGDAILLRNFKVQSSHHSMTLVSVESSAWAVFNRSKKEAHVDGPPVEYGSEEQDYATDLRQWYQEDGVGMVADRELQASIEMASREGTPTSSVALSDLGSIDDSGIRDERGESSVSNRSSRRRKSHRRITIHELRDGTRYTEVGSPSGKGGIHELRDGTVYANL